MGFWKKLFGDSPAPTPTPPPRPASTRTSAVPGTSQNVSPLRLTCAKCAAKYSVGEDSTMVTTDMAQAHLPNAVVVKSGDVKKDLVAKVPADSDRWQAIMSQARDTSRAVQASLSAGQRRVWICYQCKAENQYGSAPHLAEARAPSGRPPLNKASLTAALISAAEKGNYEAVKSNLEGGADVNAELRTGATALILAAFDGHTKVVKLLLENGADPNHKIPGKNVTALMIAAQNNHLEIARLLLEKGADANATTNEGANALWIAMQNDHSEIAKLIVSLMED